MSVLFRRSALSFPAACLVAACLVAGSGVGFLRAAQAKSVAPAAEAQGAAPEDVTVALHRALYDFKLASVHSGAGISGISGRMYYEQDDNCDAWTTEHRFRVEYQYPERRPVQNTSHYVAFESKDLSQFYFNSERQEDGATTEQLRGQISKNTDGTGKADYSKPPNLSYPLPQGYLLPTQQTNELIRRARHGDTFFDSVMFDGTDADGPVEVNAYIGKKLTPEELKELAGANKKIDPSLLTQAWHIHMAVFTLKDADDMSPSYEMDLILHDNGVVSWSMVDYKNFSVEQKLLALERLKPKKCS
jgi:hypothetical protein